MTAPPLVRHPYHGSNAAVRHQLLQDKKMRTSMLRVVRCVARSWEVGEGERAMGGSLTEG